MVSIDSINFIIKKHRYWRNSLSWFGDVERNCMYIEVKEGYKVERKPRKIWLKEAKREMKGMVLASADTLDRRAWRRKIVGDTCC